MTTQHVPKGPTAHRYREKAAHARTRAAALPLDPESAAAWLDIANSYDKLAAVAERVAQKGRGA